MGERLLVIATSGFGVLVNMFFGFFLWHEGNPLFLVYLINIAICSYFLAREATSNDKYRKDVQRMD
jgi:hypothetical protein